MNNHKFIFKSIGGISKHIFKHHFDLWKMIIKKLDNCYYCRICYNKHNKP